ncbi:MAG TPA: TIGR03118 family protein [Candidatus Limnocylindrales bacterium]|nr:TIGR03118 family protein [Candidatus Limnocylindrales bacterium]
MRVVTKTLAVLAMAVVFPCLAFAQYTRTDLVTNSGAGGTVHDFHLVNAWGLVSTGTSPFWVSDNSTGFSTLYSISNTSGVSATQVGLFVSIPSINGGLGTPTGIVAPETPKGVTAFSISGVNPVTQQQASGNSIFIFATLDGTISGWNPAVGGITATGASVANIAADRSSFGATYTGLAIANNGGQPLLYAADDGPNRRVDVFDSTFTLVNDKLAPNAFVDPKIPQKFAPYGIQTITDLDGKQTIWVTYTALDKSQSGFVDSFTTDGTLLSHFALHGTLHSPWGVALAPADFGPMSGALLISDNTSRGRINAFDPKSGAFLGPLRDASGKAIEIDDIWGIQFGQGGAAGANGNPNQLFFTAGNNDYGDGTFGVITFSK